MGFLQFLREVGKHARVNVMLSRESVKMRLDREEGISYTECGLCLALFTLHSRLSSYRRCSFLGCVLFSHFISCMPVRFQIAAAASSTNDPCRFTYQLLQGYDFVHMNRTHGVNVQVTALPVSLAILRRCSHCFACDLL